VVGSSEWKFEYQAVRADAVIRWPPSLAIRPRRSTILLGVLSILMKNPTSIVNKQGYIKEVLSYCCNELGLPLIELHFEYSQHPSIYRELALKHPFYIVREASVEFYYIYGEVGKPLDSKEFNDISSLMLFCLSDALKITDCNSIAMLWINSLVECPIDSLREYIDRSVGQTKSRDGRRDLLSRMPLAQDVADFLASTRRRRLLPVLKDTAVAECDSMVFGVSPAIIRSLPTSIIGRWNSVSGLGEAEYCFSNSTLEVVRKTSGGSPITAIAEYASLFCVGRTLWLSVSPQTTLNYDLIVSFSKDLDTAEVREGTRVERIRRAVGEPEIIVS